MPNQHIDFLPKGSIIMWYGNSNEVPAGWAICDGHNNSKFGGPVPDMRGRFAVGAKSDNSGEIYDKGQTGGAETVTLNKNQIPAHTHTGTTGSSGSHSHKIFRKSGRFVQWHKSFDTHDTGYIKTVGYDTHPNRNPKQVLRPTDALTEDDGNHYHNFTTNHNETNGNPIDIKPRYLAVYYIIKVTDVIQ